MKSLASIDQIKAELARRIDPLVKDLLPAGRYADNKTEWQEASTAAGGLGDSLKVPLRGAKLGSWGHFAAGRKGDLIALIAYLRTDDDQAAAVRWARAWLGWEGAGDPNAALAGDPAAARRARARAEQDRRRREAAEAEDVARRRRKAQALWIESSPQLRGTAADAYLQSRSIDLAALAALAGGTVTGALRIHPGLAYSFDVDGRRPVYPCLVAAVTRPPADGRPGAQIAVHRTWLQPDGSGKAPVPDPKLSLAPVAGGAIYLWRGQRESRKGGLVYGRRLSHLLKTGPADLDEATLVVGEGIENVLHIALVEPRWRAWAGISLPAMAQLRIPACFSRVVLIADPDPETQQYRGRTRRHPARVARDRVIAAWQHQGKDVYDFDPAVELTG